MTRRRARGASGPAQRVRTPKKSPPVESRGWLVVAARRRELIASLALLSAVIAVYAPSLSGGFLNWDDPWLLLRNPHVQSCEVSEIGKIWTDFSKTTRLELGAEYLPLRDLSHWLEGCTVGIRATPMRIANLLIYASAVLLFAELFRIWFSGFLPAQVAAWIFALHPVHAESVAWLAGRKDVLALLFVAAALLIHARQGPSRTWSVPLLIGCACLSKSVTVIAPALLLAQDFWLRRRPEQRVYLGSIGVALAAAALHIAVGSNVGMTTELAGGSRATALITMGPVWLRYLKALIWPASLSAIYDVPTRSTWDLPALAGYVVLVGWGLLGIALWRRRDERQLLFALAWFLVPLLPVSQLVFPLENRMADRYLLLSVGAAAVGAAWLARNELALALFAFAAAALAIATERRAVLFSDSVALFEDATAKTRESPVAPYQLGQALEARASWASAAGAYREALRRASSDAELGRRATNGLAHAYVNGGNLADAEQVLLSGRVRWPKDPKMLVNLAVVTGALGKKPQARQLYLELKRDFPKYAAELEAELEQGRGAH